MALQPTVGLFSLPIIYVVDRTPRTGDQSVSGPLFTYGTTKSIEATNLYASNGFEHTISVFGRTKTVSALDRSATVIGF
jgi:hypothetical protein